MKKFSLFCFILVLISLFSYCYGANYNYSIQLTTDEKKLFDEIKDKEINIKIKLIKVEEHDKHITTIKENYLSACSKLNEELASVPSKLEKEKEKLTKDYKKSLDEVQNEKINLEKKINDDKNELSKKKNELEYKVNERLRKEGINKKINIEKDLLGKNPFDPNNSDKITREVTTIGTATFTDDKDISIAREKAENDAKVKALEQVLGLFIESETQASDFTNLSQEITKDVKGYIESYINYPNKEIIKEENGTKTITVTVDSVVNINNVFDTIKSVQSLYEKVGKPKFVIFTTAGGSIENKYTNIIDNLFISELNKWGMDCITPDSIGLEQVDLSHNISNYYNKLKDNNVKLAFVVSAYLIDGKTNIFDRNVIEIENVWTNALIDVFNNKADSYCNINIKLVDIRTGKPIYVQNFGKSLNQIAVINDQVIKDLAYKVIYDFFYGKDVEEMKEFLFNQWADNSSLNIATIKLFDVNFNEINILKEEIKEKERFFIKFGKDNFVNNTLTLEVYNNCSTKLFINTLENIKINNKSFNIESYESKDDTLICKLCNIVPDTINVTSVILNEKYKVIKKGEKFKLNPTINPTNATNQNVTWQTSNSNIATVSNDGTVTGIKPGTISITVTTEDGNQKAVCKVKVIKK